MGIVNVTPDSFYDGGKHDSVDEAINFGLRLYEDGADILDIGGASSRPGAEPVGLDEELRRILPVIKDLSASVAIPISVDTTSSVAAEKALDAGASIINDISAGRMDARMAELVSARKCEVILMHSRGDHVSMHKDPQYADVVKEVKAELYEAIERFTCAGVDKKKIMLDPGIGFSKTAEHSVMLLKGLKEIVSMGFPVVMGTSRKSFIGKITGRSVEERLPGTLASVAFSFAQGARIFRVHDVRETRDFLKVLSVLEGTCEFQAI